MQRAVAVAVLLVSLSGCFSELLDDNRVTVRTFACAVLDADDGRPVLLELHRERGVQRVPLEALDGIADFLAREGFGPRDRFEVRESTLLEGESGWSAEALRAWARDAAVLDGDAVRLHVLWVGSFEDEAPTALLVAPGVVAVSEAAVAAGAARLERSEDFLARVLLWHVVGHALGAVNQGIPLNGTDPAAQEGPAGHEPDPRSVLYAGWDRVSAMPRTNTTHDGYSEGVVDDWRHAATEGVCA